MTIQRSRPMNKQYLGALLVALLSPMAAQAESAAAIAVIVNKDNPVVTLHIGDLARIYRGERRGVAGRPKDRGHEP